MKSGIKIIHWIIFLWILILIVSIELILDYLSLSIAYISLFFSEPESAIAVLNFRLIDSILFTIVFLLIIPLGFFFRERLRFLKSRLNLSFGFLILLCFVFLFAPVISNENPEFSKNISVTKLLPPFSSIKQIGLKLTEGEPSSESEIFRQRMDRIIKPPFDDNIIYADSVELANTVTYYQKQFANKIPADRLIIKDGSPIVKEKLFVLGTDEYGRDLFVRILYGTRISLVVGLGSVILCFFIGTLLGFIAGYKGGFLDGLLNRFSEIFLAFPVIYLVVLILGLFGSSLLSVIIVLGISGWMSLFKIVKSEVLSIKQKDYFSTAIVSYKIVRDHINL